MKYIVAFSRVFVGLLFIFSGFIKANDPLGFSYKLDEYFEVFGTEFLIPLSLFLAMFMCVLEMILGFMLLLGAKKKITLWLLMLLIIFFGFLTFYSAYFDVVKSCGCFGDAIPLTPWESFIKDMILFVLVVVLMLGEKYISPILHSSNEKRITTIFAVIAIVFPLYTYSYLPVIDFRPYAIGANIPEQTLGTPDQLKFFYQLKDKATGEEKEFDHWPEKWDSLYDYIGSRNEVVVKGIEPKIKDFAINTRDGDDITEQVLKDGSYNFILVAYNMEETNHGVQNDINDFYSLAAADSLNFICLTASADDAIKGHVKEFKSKYPICITDGTVLKTIIRSNPGLLLLKDGNILAKWHHNSFPSYSSVKETYFKE